MLKEGNGNPEVCACNLTRVFMYEVPYDRTRGIDASYIDRPADGGSKAELAENVRQTIEDYEPRVSVKAAELIADSAAHGSFAVAADIGMVIAEAEDDEE